MGKPERQPVRTPGPRVRHIVDCALEHSLASAGEDIFTLPTLLRITGPETRGSFIELGAFDGIQGSNTFMLERCLNWTGLLIEANPHHYLMLLASGRTVPKIHGAVCADPPAGGAPSELNFADALGGGSSQFYATGRGRDVARHTGNGTIHHVPCRSLTSYMADYGMHQGATVLMLDCEGAEAIVMENSPLSRFSMIVAEVIPKGLHGWIPEDPFLLTQMDVLAKRAGLHEAKKLWSKWNRIYLSENVVEQPFPDMRFKWENDLMPYVHAASTSPWRHPEYVAAVNRSKLMFGKHVGAGR